MVKDDQSEKLPPNKYEEELERIYRLERTHFQWKKQCTNFFIFALLVFVNLFRGSKENKSIVGIEHCSIYDWSSLGVYVVACIAVTVCAVK